ncbi:MAG: hypothetical protein L6W00_19810 [Lentisphaeria bacterium]|nr:MAG: hypothetical protein L6W00_19810 [Lentisphaeria bacterium]
MLVIHLLILFGPIGYLAFENWRNPPEENAFRVKIGGRELSHDWEVGPPERRPPSPNPGAAAPEPAAPEPEVPEPAPRVAEPAAPKNRSAAPHQRTRRTEGEAYGAAAGEAQNKTEAEDQAEKQREAVEPVHGKAQEQFAFAHLHPSAECGGGAASGLPPREQWQNRRRQQLQLRRPHRQPRRRPGLRQTRPPDARRRSEG